MTRLAGRTLCALVLSSLVAENSLAADAAPGDRCGPPQTVTAPYKEQICYGGAHGYAACRWVSRHYVVRVPAECPQDDLFEDAFRLPHRPAHGRAVVAKG